MTPPQTAKTSPVIIGLGALFLLALALAGSSLRVGVGPSHNFVFNVVWVKEFVAALHRGDLPPRWLAGAFGGLGAPSFVFYPPLAFYVTAAVDLVTGHRLDPRQLTAWACMLLSFASGAGLLLWLRTRTGDLWAVVAAGLFMAGPYHIIDYAVRGAFAELAAYAVLPWLVLALERAASDRRWIPALGLSYAALVLSHLPATLLVTVTVLPAYVGWRVWTSPPAERLAVVGRCLAGGVLGLALAATYLGPALLMQSASRMDWLWGADTQNWTLLRFAKWPPNDPFMPAVAFAAYSAGGAGLAAIAAVLGARRSDARTAALLWGGLAVLAVVLQATPWIWQVAPLSKVQFAYRILVVTEFAAAAAIGLAAAAGRPGRLALGLIIPVAAAVWGLHVLKPIVQSVEAPLDAASQSMIAAGRLPNEHLPAFYYPWPELTDAQLLSGYADKPLVQVEGAAGRVLSATAYPDGSVAMDVDLAAPARLVVRRLTFPSWRAERLDGTRKTPLAIEPPQRSSFVAFQGQAGRHIYRIRQVRTPLERICDGVTLLAFVLAIGLLATPRRRAGG